MRGLLVQCQVTHALIIRETRTRFGRHRLGYIWALIEPAMWIAMFGGIYLLAERPAPDGLPLVGFMATGIIPFLLFRETASRLVSSIDANKGLLFYPHIRPLDFMAARGLLELATHLMLLFLFMAGVTLWTGEASLHNVLLLLTGMLLASGLGVGLGLIFCALSVFTATATQFFAQLGRPLFWTSGLFFSTNSLPTGIRDVLLYNPVLHAVEIARDGWFASYDAEYVSVSYPAAWIMALLFFGLTLERVARRRIELS
jgi:capsular polysaccharide transport system permease protein